MADGLIRLIIADDHELIINSIKASFAGTNIAVIDSTNDPNYVLSLYQLHLPDIVLCDIRFADTPKGLDVLKALLAFDSKARVVMFSHFDDTQSILKAYQMGALAFVSKGISHHSLIKTLRLVIDGVVYIEPNIALKLAKAAIAAGLPSVNDTLKMASAANEFPKFINKKEPIIFPSNKDLTASEISDQLQYIARSITSLNVAIRLNRNFIDSTNDKVSVKEAAVQIMSSIGETFESKTKSVNLEKQISDLRSDEFRLLINRLDDALEADRKFIAMQLHDDIGASLVAIQFRLNYLKSEFENRELLSSGDSMEMSSILSQVKAVYQNIRQIGRNLRPEMLDVLGLNAALTSLINEYNRVNNLNIYFSCDDDLVAVSNEINLMVYRIVQEGMTNIIKHASATEVFIVINLKNNYLQLSIIDDGKGFDTTHRPGIGLIGIREKAHSMNGEFIIESNIGYGTTLNIILPLDNPGLKDT
jgi:signal transduction histidine kinase